MGVDFVAFGLIIDDIVFPDGRTVMGILGGGGPQAAFGMRLWSESVGLVAGAGPDLPEAAIRWFTESGIDTQGIRRVDWPTPRAWQVMEADGRRTQIFRVPGDVVDIQLGRSLDVLPAAYQTARGYHYGIHPLDTLESFACDLKAHGRRVSVEPFKPAEQPVDPHALEELFTTIEIYSPNLEEARSILGPDRPEDLARRLVGLGARVVALRMGSDGALLCSTGSEEIIHVRALDVPVVDPVGAGNAFCGAFLVGWVETGDLRTAGLRGVTAASFLVEQVGIPICTPGLRAEATRRLASIV